MTIQKSIFGPIWGPRIASAGLKLAKLAGYDAGQPSITTTQHTRLGSNPNSVRSQIERVWMEWNAEYLAKNAPFAIGYLRQRLNYCSPQGWMPNTGDATLNGEIRAYVDGWMEDGGMNCSAYDAFARMANVQLPVRGDSALVWVRDESRLRIMEAGGDQIGELNVYGNPTFISKLGLTYFSGMYFDSFGVRQAFRIYDKGTNDYYFSPHEFPASDVLYFQDNLFGGTRGVTIFHGTIKTLSKSDQLFQFGMDAAQKQAKTGVVVRNEQGGPMGELSYDAVQEDDGNVVYIERTFEGAQTQYQYNGDSYEVIKTDAPGDALIAGCEYADERSCLSLGMPFSFLVNARDVGGAPSRLEISKAGKEVERLRRVQSLPFKRMMYIIIMDAIDRGKFRGATIQKFSSTQLTKGTPKFPNLPTADAFRETQDDISSNRAGIETRAGILGRTNEDWQEVLSGNRREAMDISRAVQDANRMLKKELSPIDFQPYEGDITAADIAQNSDNPQQSATGEAITMGQPGIAPNIPGSGKGQVTDNPPNITRGVFSAYIGDIMAGDLPQSTQNDIANILGTNGTTGKLKLIKYGMVPSELEKMADAHNLESAQKHIRNVPNYACSQDVHGDQDKHVLIQNNKVIDGHHFIAKALKGGVTKSLPVIDLSPARFQGAALKEWDESAHKRGQPNNAGEFGPGDKSQQSSAEKPDKKSSEQKTAESNKRFEDSMAQKNPSDQEAHRAARADGVAIPPAWTDVVYHGKDKGVIAEGRDEKGRKQRAENPEYRQGISDANNARIANELMPRMGEIREQLKKDALAGNEEAKVLYLITQSGFRIGGKGDGKADVEAFGASNLTGDHVKLEGDQAHFDFLGKKGVRQQHSVSDPVITGFLRGKQEGKPLFSTNAAKVRAAWQDKYGGTKVHDIRHVVATELAQSELSSRLRDGAPKNEKEKKKMMSDVATTVGAKLGNNPSQALGTYIDPSIWNQIKF